MPMWSGSGKSKSCTRSHPWALSVKPEKKGQGQRNQRNQGHSWGHLGIAFKKLLLRTFLKDEELLVRKGSLIQLSGGAEAGVTGRQ